MYIYRALIPSFPTKNQGVDGTGVDSLDQVLSKDQHEPGTFNTQTPKGGGGGACEKKGLGFRV